MKIRQGNAFTVNWTIVVNKGQTPLSDLDLTVEVTNPIGQSFYPSFVVEDDHLSIPISIKMQKWTGLYHLTCWCNKGQDDQTVVDDINAFEIVDRAEENFEVVSVVEVGVSSLYYNLGGMSAYEIAVAHGFDGTEQDWLESLHQPAKDAAEDIAEMQEQADAALADVINSKEEISSLNEQATELLEKLENAEATIADADAAAQEAREAADNANEVLEKLNDVNAAIDNANTAAADARAAQAELQEDIDAIKENADNITDATNQLKDALDNAQEAITKVDNFMETVDNIAYKEDIPSLDGYATEEWVTAQNYLTTYTDTVYDDTEVKNRLAELESIDHSKFLTEHQSLAGYATEEWVEGKKYLTSYTDTVYDDTEVKNRLAELESIDHSKFLTEHQSLDGYVTSDKLNDYALKTDLTNLDGYATEEWVESKNYLTTYTDTVYDDTEVKNRLAELESIDHSKFLTKHQSLDDYALKSEVPSLDGYATQEWVNNTINNLPEGGILVEEDPIFLNWIKNNKVAYVGDIPSLDGYATQSWVEQQNYLTTYTDTVYDDTEVKNRLVELESIDHSKYLTEHQSLDDYALKSEIPSLDGYVTSDKLGEYATEEWVESKNYLTTYTDTVYDDSELVSRIEAIETADTKCNYQIVDFLTDAETGEGQQAFVKTEKVAVKTAVDKPAGYGYTYFSVYAPKDEPVSMRYSINYSDDYTSITNAKDASKYNVGRSMTTTSNTIITVQYDMNANNDLPAWDKLSDTTWKYSTTCTQIDHTTGVTNKVSSHTINFELIEQNEAYSVYEIVCYGANGTLIFIDDTYLCEIQDAPCQKIYVYKNDGWTLIDNDTEERLAALESIDHSKYLTEHQSLDGYATEEWVESKNYLTTYTDTVYDDTEVKNRLAELESIDHSKYLTEHQSLDNYVTLDTLDGYATEEWVTAQNYLTEHQSLDDYALKSEVPSLDGYATEEWVTSTLSNLPSGGILVEEDPVFAKWLKNNNVAYAGDIPSLDGYALKSEVPSLDGYATQSWVEGKKYLTSYTDTKYDDTNIKNRLTALESIDHSKYLTEHQSLDGYATEEWVEQKEYLTQSDAQTKYATPGWVSSGFVSHMEMSMQSYVTSDKLAEYGFATQSWVTAQKYLTSYTDTVYDDRDLQNRVTALELIDHDGYATKEWVEGKNYLTSYIDTKYDDTDIKVRLAALEKIDHSDYVTHDDMRTTYNNLATQEWVQQWVDQQDYLTSYIDTKYDDTEVKNRLATLEAIDHNAFLQHKDLTLYATTDWVEQQGYLTEHQPLDGYATQEWVEQQGYGLPYNDSELKDRLDRLESIDHDAYATQEWVQQQGYGTGSGYDDTEVKNRLATLEAIDHDGYATKEWVEQQGYSTGSGYDDTEVKNRLSELESIDHTQYLTEHQSLDAYATKSAVNNMLVWDEATKTLTINYL